MVVPPLTAEIGCSHGFCGVAGKCSNRYNFACISVFDSSGGFFSLTYLVRTASRLRLSSFALVHVLEFCLVYCICYILTWCVVLVVLDTTVGSNVCNGDSLCDLNCRNSMLENMKLKLPSVYKTGTTIAGVVFKVGVTLLL